MSQVPKSQTDTRPEGRSASKNVSVEVNVGTECLVKEGNQQLKTVIGALQTHTATSTHPIQSVQWTIGGQETDTVANYVITPASGTVTLLTNEDLTKNPITFAWWRSGTYNVTATITTSVGTEVVTNTFDVTAPLVRDVNWSGDGVVAVGSYKDQGQMIRLADKSNFNKDGLYMNFVVAGNQSSTGMLAGIQLASNERVAQYNDDQYWKRAINGIYVLDVGLTNTVLYQNYTVPIGNTGGNVTYEPHDGPGQGLEITNLKAMYIGDGTPEVVPETYLMYAMFRPNLEAAIWVPIKVLKWGWEGYTEYIDGAWTPAKEGKIPTPVPSDPSNFPQWDRNTNDRNWVPYGGEVIARKLKK